MKPKHKQMKKKITPKHNQVAQYQKHYVEESMSKVREFFSEKIIRVQRQWNKRTTSAT